ncbi:hypothetical protein [Tahibacter soli]|uniref:Uncharacterized protein n=1 Tax=Tahibacter soli TaxID=2983605 RepID=A0A9X3YL31_9GAMM|nr:hypothetical protein [Tahibacter soli]MDC8014376.1 hypothetical protein [Tahibacter soli]
MVYQEIRIWKKIGSDMAVRYFCLLDISSGKYRVQSADFFRLPVTAEQVKFFESQAAELFIETSSAGVDDWHVTIEKAIEMHEKNFS